MKKMMMVGIVGMVLVSFASAGLVDFLSNSISGTVEVFGPVFYLDRTDIMGDGSFSLKLNDDDVEGSYFWLTAGETDSREFFSESLGVDGFYPLDFDITLETAMTGLNETAGETGSINIMVFLVKENGESKDFISLCNIIHIGLEGEETNTITCEVGDGLIKIDSSDRLKVLLNDGSPTNSTMKVYLGNSKMEMIAQ